MSQGVSFNARHEINKLEATLKDLSSTKRQCRAHMLRASQDLLRREERASVLASSGGSAGMMEFSATGNLESEVLLEPFLEVVYLLGLF